MDKINALLLRKSMIHCFMHKIPSLNLILRKFKNVAPHLFILLYSMRPPSGPQNENFTDTSPNLLLHASPYFHFTFHIIKFEIL